MVAELNENKKAALSGFLYSKKINLVIIKDQFLY